MRTLSLPRHQRFAIGQRASGGQCGPTRRVASAGPRGVARKPKSAFRTPVVAFLDQRPEGQEANVAGLTRVHFVCMQKVNVGDTIKVVGDAESMGKWNVANAPSMTWAEGHLWRATLDLPAGAASFKFVQVSPAGQSVWESGDNRSITVAAGSGAGEPVLLQVVAGVWNMPAVSDAIVAAQKAAAGGGDNGQDGKKTAFALPQWPFSGKEAPSQAQSHGSKADAAEVAKVAAPKAATTAPAVAVPVTVVSAAKPQQTDVMVVEPVGSAANAVVENSSPVTAAAVAPPAAAVTDDDNSAKRSGPLDAVARNAGYLALGVAGAAGLGALAMDASMVVDLAMLGAVGAAAAAATDSRRKVVEVTQHQEGADSDAPRRYDDPTIVLAAGLLSAFETSTAALDALISSTGSSASPAPTPAVATDGPQKGAAAAAVTADSKEEGDGKSTKAAAATSDAPQYI